MTTDKRVVNEEFKEAMNNDPVVLEWRKRIGERFLVTYQSLEGEAAMREEGTPLQFHYAKYVALMREEGTPLQFHYAKYVALNEMAVLAALADRHQIRANAHRIGGEDTDLTREDFLRNAGRAWDKLANSLDQKEH